MNASARINPPANAGGDAVNRSALAHQPTALAAFNTLYATLWSRGVLDHPAKEIARLRNARITNCVYCRNVRFDQARQDGLGEEQVAMITDGYAASALDDRSKLIIRYADVFLKNPSGLTDALRAEMRATFSPEQIVELTAALALFMGFSKIAVSIGGMPDSLPTMVIPTPV